MNGLNNSKKTARSDEDLARMIANVANVAQADAIICATETGVFAKLLHGMSGQIRVIGATTKRDTYDVLTQAGLESILLPLRAIDKYSQVRHVVSVALKSATVSVGNLIVCALGRDVYQEEGDLVVLTDVEHSVEHLSITDFLKLTDAIQPKVLEIAISIACKIGRAARRGKRLGAISIHDAIVELSKLDGAFVIRGDGLIQTAGTFLTSPKVKIVLPAGLGARHFAAAAVTKRTTSTAVVVSATDGNVRVFSGGAKVLHIDSEIPYGPITTEV
jgi:DNA integrity scanning protein DisA with diadenylate cyclase activity